MIEKSKKCDCCKGEFYNLSNEPDYKSIEVNRRCVKCYNELSNNAQIIEENTLIYPDDCDECKGYGYLEDDYGITTCDCMQIERDEDLIDNKL